MLFQDTGVLEYTDHGLRLIVDEGIVRYYRSMIPKNVEIQPQRHPAHISVVRNESVFDHPLWRKHEGLAVDFEYEHLVYSGQVYWWLNAFSKTLEDIREELGLPVTAWYTRPPGDYKKCFHITIGNSKNRNSQE